MISAPDKLYRTLRYGITLCGALLLSFQESSAQNYDETKVPAYNLPEVLKNSNGEMIKSKSSWQRKRRPEVLKLFEDNIYGQMPKAYDNIKFTVTNEVPGAMDGKASLKEVTISVYKENVPVHIHLILFVPNHRKKPVPAFLLINNRDTTNTDPKRKIKSEFWPAEMIIDSGYAIAAFHVSNAAPDNKITFQKGVLQLYPDQLNADNGMHAIGAWAWAASRIMDFFKKEQTIDANKIFLVGHSRGGKAALWAGAQDQRFAIIFSNCSGNTGAALSRRKFGETIKVINTSFPHWFTKNYKKYNDNEAQLPVDQHMLISLMAPRPVYVTSADKDLWADPKGSYLSLIHAQAVYALYNKQSRLTPEPPPVNTPIIRSILGYHNREGLHNLTAYDWINFIRFANFHLYHK